LDETISEGTSESDNSDEYYGLEDYGGPGSDGHAPGGMMM